jgi:hypothetical protein
MCFILCHPERSKIISPMYQPTTLLIQYIILIKLKQKQNKNNTLSEQVYYQIEISQMKYMLFTYTVVQHDFHIRWCSYR